MIELKNICFAVLFLPLFFTAQGPGYLGKKTAIGYGIEISPVLSDASNGLPINLIHQLFYENAVKSTVAVGISFRYANTKYDNKAEVTGLGKPTSYYRISAFSFSPYFKFFSKKFVAPWGKYWMIGPVLNVALSKHDRYMYIPQTIIDHDTLLMNFGPDKQLHNSFDVMVGIGKSRILKDKIVIDYGLNLQIIALISRLKTADYSKVSQEDYIKYTAINRVRGLNRFNVFLKLGYLF